jgi:hypothetical protein
VLAVRAAREQGVLGPLGQAGQRGQDRGELAQEDLVSLAHLEELAGLRDILRRRPPVHVAPGVALAGAIERPHQRHDRMTGPRQSLPHGSEVQVLEVRLAGDLAGGVVGDDAQLGLRLSERRFHVEPRLEARGLGEQGTHAGVVDPEGGRLL